MKYKWYQVSKSFRGGRSEYQIRVPEIELTKDDWDDILEWIGDNTSGGHNYGYNIKTKELGDKDPRLKVLSYPSSVSYKLERFGKTVVHTTKMI